MLLKKILLTTLFISLPINSYSLTIQELGHILNKTGFSPNTKEAKKFLDKSFESSIDKIINESNIQTETKYPKTNKDYLTIQLKDLSQQEKKIYQAKFRNEAFLLKEWWYQEMIKTDSPLTERMTMFWHNHFTSSIKKIKIPDLMLEQNKLFRKYSLGNFRELLKEIVKDPAMLMYLDTQSNKKNAPNENFARELLELFTMGEGNYTEKDIKESAKAFTGLRFNREKGEVVFNKKQFNNTKKTFLGETGNFKSEDIINIILKQPQTAIFITTKLWKEFVSYDLNNQEINKLAQVFIDNNYELKPLLKALFKTRSFRDNIGTQIKSPTELMVGTIRQFEIPVTEKELKQIVKHSANLGQDIFNPPNVKGWLGGNEWITSDTLMLRRQFLQKALRSNDSFYLKKNKKKMSSDMTMANTWNEDLFNDYSKEEIKDFLLPINPVNKLNDNEDLISYIKNLVLDPVYQLK